MTLGRRCARAAASFGVAALLGCNVAEVEPPAPSTATPAAPTAARAAASPRPVVEPPAARPTCNPSSIAVSAETLREDLYRITGITPATIGGQ